MNQKHRILLAMSFAVLASRSQALPPESLASSHVPPSIAAKKESPEIMAALNPLRAQLRSDEQALKAARKAGDQAGITAATAAIKADYKAIKAKRLELIKNGTK